MGMSYDKTTNMKVTPNRNLRFAIAYNDLKYPVKLNDHINATGDFNTASYTEY